MDKDGFICGLLALWREDCNDIDGEDFQALLLKHGLATSVPATQADCEEAWYLEYDFEPGDPMLKYHADLMALLKAHGEKEEAER